MSEALIKEAREHLRQVSAKDQPMLVAKVAMEYLTRLADRLEEVEGDKYVRANAHAIAESARAEEREACAKIADAFEQEARTVATIAQSGWVQERIRTAVGIADRIRARSRPSHTGEQAG